MQGVPLVYRSWDLRWRYLLGATFPCIEFINLKFIIKVSSPDYVLCSCVGRQKQADMNLLLETSPSEAK